MPQFQYKAFDAEGISSEGQISANTAHEAVRALVSTGLKVHSVQAVESHGSLQDPVKVSVVPDNKSAALVTGKPTSIDQRRVTNAGRQTPSSYAEMFFFFAQLSRLLQSGISPHQAMLELAQRQRISERKECFAEIAGRAGEGIPLSSQMEQYPDVFTPGMAGAVRAGENGGYLWQACESVSKQQQRSEGIRKTYWWVNLLLVSSVLIFPLVIVLGQGLDSSFASASGLPGLVSGTGKALIGPAGWTFAALALVFLVMRQFLNKTESRGLRHRVGFQTPILGKRATQENLALLTWHLGLLAKAGLSPQASWDLASQAVPNLAYRDAIRSQVPGGTIGEGVRLSTLLRSSRIVPEEYLQLIETGEMTGSVPRALDEASELSRQDVAATEQHLKWKMGCWGLLVVFGISAIAYVLFARSYIDSLFRHILEDF